VQTFALRVLGTHQKRECWISPHRAFTLYVLKAGRLSLSQAAKNLFSSAKFLAPE
jgi:hypothetical protein